MLLLASDIVVNPGSLDVCLIICLQILYIVAEHHRAVLCDVCSKWYHAKCVDISVEHYERLSFQDDSIDYVNFAKTSGNLKSQLRYTIRNYSDIKMLFV